MPYKRDNGSWSAKVHVGGGRYRHLGTYATKREAKAAENRERLKRVPSRRTSETCDEFAARWPTDYPRDSLATASTYRSAVKPFAKDFKGVKLDELDRDTVRRWAAGKPRSSMQVLRAMFNDAKDDRLVEVNPFEKLYRRRKNVTPQVGAKKQIWVPTIEQLEQLAEIPLGLNGEYGPTFRAYILFLAHSGMRPGEVAVLEDDCIDFDAGEIHVVRNLDGAGQVNDYTKNGQQRTIALLQGAAEALRSYPRRVDVLGQGGRPLLFTGPQGAVLGKGPRHNLWNPVRAVFGRPKMRLYDLRHYCATWLLERGATELDVSVQLGHTDGGALVRSTYGHAERSSLERLRAIDSGVVAPLRVASESRAGGESA